MHAQGALALEELDDDALMALVAVRSSGLGAVDAAEAAEAAFAVLVRRHQAKVLRVCARSLGGDAALARDVAQATFIELHKAACRYEPRGRFRAFLMRIALRQCAMAGRERTSRRRREDASARADASANAASSPTPDQSVLAHEQRAAVDVAIARLSPRLRDVVLMRYAGELALDEIAEALDLPLGTVKSRLFAALEKLRAELESP